MFDDDVRDRAPDPLAAWPAFIGAVRKRLEAGRAAYGDRSFARPSPELLDELEQEALDLAGWGYVLWSRLRALRAAAQQVEAAAPPPPIRLTGADRALLDRRSR